MIIIKKGLHSLPSLKPLEKLVKNCEKADGFPFRLYWYLLQNRFTNSTNEFDYLAYVNNQLVGALQINDFVDGVVITAMVCPRFRKRGIFNRLLKKALEVLNNTFLTHCFLVCNSKNDQVNHWMQNCGGQLIRSVSEWQAPTQIVDLPINIDLTIVKAQLSDIAKIVEINNACFPSNFDDLLPQKYMNDLQEIYRHMYLAKSKDKDIVGKLHIREEECQIMMHDVAILPSFQKRGLGRSLILNWLINFATQFSKPIMVEVINNNIASLRLFHSCEFIKKNVYNYYEFNMGDIKYLLNNKLK